MSLRTRLLLVLTMLPLLLLGLLGWYFYHAIQAITYQHYLNDAHSTAQVLEEMLAEHPELFTSANLQPVLHRFAGRISNVARVTVLDHTGREVAGSGDEQVELPLAEADMQAVLRRGAHRFQVLEWQGRRYVLVISPVEGPYDSARRSGVLGVVVLVLHLGRAERELGETFLQGIMLLLALVLLILVPVGFLIRRSIIVPLDRLGQAASDLGCGIRSGRATVERIDEIGTLAQAFNQMADRLEQQERERAQATEILRESEEKFRQLAETVAEVFWVYDVLRNQILYISPAYESVWGQPCAAIYDNPGAWLDAVHPEDRERIREGFLRVAEVDFDHEYRIVRPDGTERWIHGRSFCVYGNQGTPIRSVGIAQDITERKAAEKQLLDQLQTSRFQVEVGHILTSETVPQVCLQRCAEAIVQHLDAAFARIWTLNDAEQVLELQASAGMYTHIDGGHARVPVGKFKIGLIAQEKKPHLTNQVVGDPRVGDQEWARREGMVAFAGYPLLVEGRLVGVMAMFARHALATETTDRLVFLAASVAQTILRQRLIASLTEARRAADEVRRHLTLVLDSAGEGIYGLDTSGSTTFVNPAAARMLGYEIQELIGKPMHAVTHHSRKDGAPYPREECPVHRAFRDGTVHRVADEVFWRKDGSSFPVAYVATPIRTEGRLVGGVCVFQNISERLRVQTELHEAKQAADAANRAKGDFLAVMSHEIRTPMNGVIGMLGLLLDTPLTDRQREIAGIAHASADNLLTIINDILDFSRIEAGKLTIEPVAFDLRQVVEEVGSAVGFRAAERGLELFLHYPLSVPRRFRGDAGRIRQVLTNLAGNAIKFTEKGHVLLRVEAEEQTDTDVSLRLSVQDTGIGIAADRVPHLFGMFTQADTSITRRYGGTGLGLAISKRLVDLMFGTIGVSSQPGAGSTFWFRLRLPLDLEAPADPSSTLPELAGVRVLVVAAEALSREILHDYLHSWRLGNDSCASGAEALARLREGQATGVPYPIALIDGRLPDLDGLALGRSIKADPLLREVMPVLLLSPQEHLDPEQVREAGLSPT